MLIELIKKQMPECDVKLENNLIYIFKDGKATHYDYNYLNYLYESGQLTQQNIKFMLLLINKLP
jgi:hypothetical protein